MVQDLFASQHAPIVLAGPTATGKTEIAICLAERLRGEIISVDSMQVYRGMDIGTAKPSAAELVRAPHHLIDVADISEPFDAARFVALARAAIEEIQARGHLPILCGGTGLYFKALFEGLGSVPAGDPNLRAILEITPTAELLQELRVADSATYEKIDGQNPRRVIRAVEVLRLTGKPFSSQRASWNVARKDAPPLPRNFGLLRVPADLRARIDVRIDQMFRLGLVEETRSLLNAGLAGNRTALQALGYRQVAEYLGNKRSLAETIALVKVRTRQFAKRQMTWFRRQLSLTWVSIPPLETAEETTDRLTRQLNLSAQP